MVRASIKVSGDADVAGFGAALCSKTLEHTWSTEKFCKLWSDVVCSDVSINSIVH